jgi:hypothetical protein
VYIFIVHTDRVYRYSAHWSWICHLNFVIYYYQCRVICDLRFSAYKYNVAVGFDIACTHSYIHILIMCVHTCVHEYRVTHIVGQRLSFMYFIREVTFWILFQNDVFSKCIFNTSSFLHVNAGRLRTSFNFVIIASFPLYAVSKDINWESVIKQL